MFWIWLSIISVLCFIVRDLGLYVPQSSFFVSGKEPTNNIVSVIELVVNRGPGIFGTVSVDYQVRREIRSWYIH